MIDICCICGWYSILQCVGRSFHQCYSWCLWDQKEYPKTHLESVLLTPIITSYLILPWIIEQLIGEVDKLCNGLDVCCVDAGIELMMGSF